MGRSTLYIARWRLRRRYTLCDLIGEISDADLQRMIEVCQHVIDAAKKGVRYDRPSRRKQAGVCGE